MSFTITRNFNAKSTDKRLVEDLLYMTVAPTKKYEGCLSYEVYKKDEMRGDFLIISSWVNSEDYERYVQSDLYKSVQKVLDRYVEGVLEEEFLNLSDISQKDYFESVSPEVKELLTDDIVREIKEGFSIEVRLEELEDDKLRLQAQLQNQKRMFEKEKENLKSYVVEDFVKRMLTVLDTVEMGLKYGNKEVSELGVEDLKKEYQGLIEGMDLTVNKLEDLFKQNNIQKVEAEGEFNPEIHQAISVIQDQEFGDNQIVSVLQEGYYYNDKLIRPSMVVVSKNSKEESYG